MHGTTAIIIIFEIKIPRYAIHRTYTHSLSQSQFNLFRFDTPHHVPFECRSDNQANCLDRISVSMRFTRMRCVCGTPSLISRNTRRKPIISLFRLIFALNYHLPNHFLSIHPNEILFSRSIQYEFQYF